MRQWLGVVTGAARARCADCGEELMFVSLRLYAREGLELARASATLEAEPHLCQPRRVDWRHRNRHDRRRRKEP